MKHSLLLKLALAIFAISGWMTAKSQSTVSIDFLFDSTTTYCPTPVDVSLTGGGVATGLDPSTDSIEVFLAFGDGTDTTFMVPIFGNSTSANYWIWMQHSYLLAGNYTVSLTVTDPNGATDNMTYGPILVSNGCSLIEGYTYVDNNGNCVFDAGDDTLKYVPITATVTGLGVSAGAVWSGANGYYSFYVPSGINMDLTVNAFYGLTANCPAGGSYAVNLGAGTTNTYDFGFTCNSSAFDLATFGSGWGFVPGNDGYLYVYANNYSCLATGGTLTLTLDNQVSYTGTAWGTAPTSVSGNTVTWTIPPMSFSGNYTYFGQFFSKLKVTTDTNASIGDTVCFNLSITPTAGDANTGNNTYNMCYPVLASWDPNMKEVNPVGVGTGGDVNPGTSFTYTVHFQNTGSYPAEDIYILDTISTNLDMATLEMIGSSHPMLEVLELGNNILKFDFEDIWLPDSTNNEPESHGYVMYRIKAKNGLGHGTQIENTAHIFFDYNPAVVTNTTLNTIKFGVGIDENLAQSALIYPNPVKDNLNIQFKSHFDGVVSVVDMTGRTVKTFTVNGSTAVFNASNLAPGVYSLVSSGQAVGRFTVSR